MKDIKEVALGLFGALYAAYELARDHWDVATKRQKYITLALVAIPLLLLSTCAFAAHSDKLTHFYKIHFPTHPFTYMCYMENDAFESDRIYDCMALLKGPAHPEFGQAYIWPEGVGGFCIIDGVHNDGVTPTWSCSLELEEIKAKKIGF